MSLIWNFKNYRKIPTTYLEILNGSLVPSYWCMFKDSTCVYFHHSKRHFVLARKFYYPVDIKFQVLLICSYARIYPLPLSTTQKLIFTFVYLPGLPRLPLIPIRDIIKVKHTDSWEIRNKQQGHIIHLHILPFKPLTSHV